MDNINYKNIFSKRITEGFIYELHETGVFNVKEFEDYIRSFNEYLSLEVKENQILQEVVDSLIYTLSCLMYHHDTNDMFKIINYSC